MIHIWSSDFKADPCEHEGHWANFPVIAPQPARLLVGLADPFRLLVGRRRLHEGESGELSWGESTGGGFG
jgi:hypothetical protein